MAWRIEITESAARQIKKLDPSEAVRIRTYLRDRIAALDHPRQVGTALHGSRLGDYWRYRVGDYRLFYTIDETRIVVLVADLRSRQDAYRTR